MERGVRQGRAGGGEGEDALGAAAVRGGRYASGGSDGGGLPEAPAGWTGLSGSCGQHTVSGGSREGREGGRECGRSWRGCLDA